MSDLPFHVDAMSVAAKGVLEHRVQSAIVKAVPAVFRGYRAISIPNGAGKLKIGYAAHLRRTGLVSGVPDLLVVGPEGFIAFLEVKAETNLSDSQRLMCRWLHDLGHRVAVVRSMDSAVERMREWLSL